GTEKASSACFRCMPADCETGSGTTRPRTSRETQLPPHSQRQGSDSSSRIARVSFVPQISQIYRGIVEERLLSKKICENLRNLQITSADVLSALRISLREKTPRHGNLAHRGS